MAFSFITEAFGKVKTLLLNVDENYAITTLGLTDATGTAWNPVTNANPVPISDAGGSLTVDGPVTDTQLRASAVPVSGTVTANVGTGTQPVSGTVTANFGTIAGAATEATLDARSGALTETAPATDTASSGLNGRLQRIAQRLTSLIALLPTSLGGAGGLKVEIVAGGSGGTQYAEDVATTGAELTTLAGVVRQDTPAGSTSNDGDVTWAKSDSVGRLWVNNSGVTQPVSGTVTANIGTGTLAAVTSITNVVHVDDNAASITTDATGTTAHDAAAAAVAPVLLGGYASAAAPTDVSADGDAVRAWMLRNGARVTNIASGGTLVTIGQKVMASSLPVVLASDQGAVSTSSSGTVAHDGVGTGANPVLQGGYASAAAPTDVSTDGDAVRGWFLRNGARASVLTAAGALIGGDATNGLDVDVTRVTGTVTTKETRSSTSTLTNVASSATSVTLLAANANRLGATIWNDSTAILYVKFGTTASATSCTVKLIADAYYEVPFGTTDRIDGIWATANGNARVTEFS